MRVFMRVSMTSNGHRFDIQTNTWISPEETVFYDGKEVSRRRAWFASKHAFTVTEDGKSMPYELEVKLNFWVGGIELTLRRNGDVVLSIH
jgi:hypothetical protein